MINWCFSHISLLVLSVDESAEYLNSLGIQSNPAESFKSEGTKEIYVGNYERNNGLLLLVEAIGEGPYQKALLKRGPSLHHIGLNVQNLEDFVIKAQKAGWMLHPVSQHSMVQSQTAWLFLKGVPTLIEVYQNDEIASNANLVSKIEIPTARIELFEAIGLGGIVLPSEEGAHLAIEGKRLSFNQIACVK